MAAPAAPANAVFMRYQMDTIDPEPLLDSEYFVDLRSFSYPASWDRLWEGSTTAYRLNGASLDCCSLFLQQEFRFERRLTPRLMFRFRLEQREDKERQDMHHWLEFERSMGAGFSAVVLGEPAFKKEDADIGLGIGWTRGAVALWARRIWVDWNFNGRGSTTQSYERYPISDQFGARAETSAGRWAARLEIDHPLRRVVPDESRLFSYRRTTLTASWALPRAGWTPRAEYGYELQRTGDLFAAGVAKSSVDYRRRVHRGTLSVERVEGPDEIEVGHAFFARAARADAPQTPGAAARYRRWESQPYARLRRGLRPGLIGELASFLSIGEDRRFYVSGQRPGHLETIVEAKLASGLDFVFGPTSRVGVNFTFDLDSATRHFWDGGNVRALILF